MRLAALILTVLLPFTFVVQAESLGAWTGGIESLECACPGSTQLQAVACCEKPMKCCLREDSSSEQSSHPVEFQWSRAQVDTAPQLFVLIESIHIAAEPNETFRPRAFPTADPPPNSASICSMKQSWLI